MKTYPKKSRKPLQAIRFFCFECMGWDRTKKDSGKPFDLVRECADKDCPLYDFRFGKNPFHRSKGNSESLKNYRQTLNYTSRNERESTINSGSVTL